MSNPTLLSQMCAYYGVRRLEDLTARQFADAVNWLDSMDAKPSKPARDPAQPAEAVPASKPTPRVPPARQERVYIHLWATADQAHAISEVMGASPA